MFALVASCLLGQGFASSLETRLEHVLEQLDHQLFDRSEEFMSASRGARAATDGWKQSRGYKCERFYSLPCNQAGDEGLCLVSNESRNKIIEGRQIQGQKCVWVGSRQYNKCQPKNHPVVDGQEWKECSNNYSHYTNGKDPSFPNGIELLTNNIQSSGWTRCYSTERCQAIFKNAGWYSGGFTRRKEKEAREFMPTMVESELQIDMRILKYLKGPAPNYCSCEKTKLAGCCEITLETCIRMECEQNGGTIDWSDPQKGPRRCPLLQDSVKVAYCNM